MSTAVSVASVYSITNSLYRPADPAAQRSGSYESDERSLNQSATSTQNARTPSDIQAVQFREDGNRVQERAIRIDRENSTGVLGDSLTQAQQDTLDALSRALGKDSATLRGDLENGSTLQELAEHAELDSKELAQISQDGLLVDVRA
jgi:hypothetical protein